MVVRMIVRVHMVAHYFAYPALFLTMVMAVACRSRIGVFRMRSCGIEHVSELRPYIRLPGRVV